MWPLVSEASTAPAERWERAKTYGKARPSRDRAQLGRPKQPARVFSSITSTSGSDWRSTGVQCAAFSTPAEWGRLGKRRPERVVVSCVHSGVGLQLQGANSGMCWCWHARQDRLVSLRAVRRFNRRPAKVARGGYAPCPRRAAHQHMQQRHAPHPITLWNYWIGLASGLAAFGSSVLLRLGAVEGSFASQPPLPNRPHLSWRRPRTAWRLCSLGCNS